MLMTKERASVVVVSDDVGTQIEDRRTRLGLSRKALAERAGVDRGRLAEIEKGTAHNVRPATMGAIRQALDSLEAGRNTDLPEGARRIGDPADGLIEVEIEGTGIRVVVKGPVRDVEEIQATALHYIREIQTKAKKAGPPST